MGHDFSDQRHKQHRETAGEEEVELERLDISIETMWHTNEQVNEWSRGADVKAGIVLAANGVILVASAALAVGTGGFIALLETLRVAIFFIAVLITVIISSGFAALCLVPPLREGEMSSLLAIDHIAFDFSTATAYEDAVRSALTDTNAMLTVVSHEVWTSARRAGRKLYYVTWAIRFLIASLFFSLITLLIAFL